MVLLSVRIKFLKIFGEKICSVRNLLLLCKVFPLCENGSGEAMRKYCINNNFQPKNNPTKTKKRTSNKVQSTDGC